MAKKAVLIGINYPGTKAALDGCVNDVKRMHSCLIKRFGFSKEDITVLIDTDDSYTQPTGQNIREALSKLVKSAEKGDYLFVHYSGHGTRLPPGTGEVDDTGYDECIVPCDMNFITDDDFRELVNQVPEGCQITVVSDSCHSGGLLDKAKEQIGESVKKPRKGKVSTWFGSKKVLPKSVDDASKTRDIHNDDEGEEEEEEDEDEEENSSKSRVIDTEGGDQVYVKDRSLPLSAVIEILQEKTGMDDIDVGQLRPALYDIFGADATPKVKKFMNVTFDKLQQRDGEEIDHPAQQYVVRKLEENDKDYTKPAMEMKVGGKHEVYAGSSNVDRGLMDSGILVSGCQTSQTSADASPTGGEPYGAFSNVIQEILAATEGPISYKELVTGARLKLRGQGFTQRPGLYCDDKHIDAPFVC